MLVPICGHPKGRPGHRERQSGHSGLGAANLLQPFPGLSPQTPDRPLSYSLPSPHLWAQLQPGLLLLQWGLL